MRWSILIPSLTARDLELSHLISRLSWQCNLLTGIQVKTIPVPAMPVIHLIYGNMEIVAAVDNKQITTGVKRNVLLAEAQGTYCSFIDDDDEVTKEYIPSLLEATYTNADVITFHGYMTTDGKDEIGWELGKDLPNKTIIKAGKPFYVRTANHLACVKTTLARAAGFPDQSHKEDSWYSERLQGLLKTEHKIDKVLYHYKYSTKEKQYS